MQQDNETCIQKAIVMIMHCEKILARLEKFYSRAQITDLDLAPFKSCEIFCQPSSLKMCGLLTCVTAEQKVPFLKF